MSNEERMQENMFTEKNEIVNSDEGVMEWVIPINTEKGYRVDEAFKEHKILHWQQISNFTEGDIAYIYETSPDKAIKYKCRINRVNMSDASIDDRKYNIREFENKGRFYEIELLKELQGEEYKLDRLVENGFSPQVRPIRVIDKLKKYLHELEMKNSGKIMIDKYVLTITKDSITSTDARFNINELMLGDKYKPLETYFEKANGTRIERIHAKNERKISNQTMPRIALQIYEGEIAALSDDQKKEFPICRYTANGMTYKGIYSSSDEFKKYRKTIEYLTYTYGNGKQFVIYCWNIFSPIIFVQECLKRFGDDGDKFILKYCEKTPGDVVDVPEEPVDTEYKNGLSKKLIESKNIIFRGAPGTGKTFLAKQIAADIVSSGTIQKYDKLSVEQKKQIEFVQFHPSYDYTDFVEGLRPKINNDGSMGFELQDGIFKRFCARAEENSSDLSEAGKKYIFIIDEINRGEISKIFGELFFSIDPGYRGHAGEVSTQYANLHSDIQKKFCIPKNVYVIGTMNDIDRSVDTFDFAMRRRFRFIELKANDNMQMFDAIGNDDTKEEAKCRMVNLNNKIVEMPELNENYQIGAAYFMKLNHLTSDELWEEYLQPLLQEYIHGMPDEKDKMTALKKAYNTTTEKINNTTSEEAENGENTQD